MRTAIPRQLCCDAGNFFTDVKKKAGLSRVMSVIFLSVAAY